MTTPESGLPTPPSGAPLGLDGLLTGISSSIRWKIFDELLKGEPLPVKEISKRLNIPAVNASKHLLQLVRCGLVERTISRAYRIPARFIMPGGKALDFGHVILRLDYRGK